MLKRTLLGFALICSFFVISPNTAHAKKDPVTLSVELLGRGLLYSLNLDFMLGSKVAFGFGGSYISATSGGARAQIIVVPVYTNIYFSSSPSSMYLTFGADYLSAKAEVGSLSATGSAVAGVAGFGYEYRNGFLFRVAPYVFFGSGGAAAWIGFSFGVSF